MPASRSASSRSRAVLVRLLDEVEQHDDVADDDADEADDPEEGHEAEGLVHDRQHRQRAAHAVGHGREHDERLDRVVELEDQREVDQAMEMEHDERHLREALVLLLVLAADLDAVAGGKRGGDRVDRRACGVQHLGRQMVGERERGDGDRADLVAPLDLRGASSCASRATWRSGTLCALLAEKT